MKVPEIANISLYWFIEVLEKYDIASYHYSLEEYDKEKL
jgi:hypothetical protein